MDIQTILLPERTVARLPAGSKKRALEQACEHLAATLPLVKSGAIYRGLLGRERLGTTAIGEGVAIPHCRLDACQSVVAGLFTLEGGVDFAAPDDQPVQIMVALLAPALSLDNPQEHLQTLAMLAERLQSPAYRQSLIAAETSADLYQAAISDQLLAKAPSA